MYRSILRILTISIFFSLCGNFSLQSVELLAPNVVNQGDVMQIMVKDGLLTDVVLTLISTEGHTVGRAEGFQWTSPDGKKINVVLLGISPHQEPGYYYIKLQAMDNSAVWKMEKPVTIRVNDYLEKTERLTDTTNRLIDGNNKEQKHEAQILWSILNHYDPMAIHHTGTLIIPINKINISSDTGGKRRYINPADTNPSSIHFGRDLWLETGTPIHAAGKGRVALAANRFQTGNTVVLEHLPGIYTLYYHLDSINVREGQLVYKGTVLGKPDKVEPVSNDFQYWEMRVGGIPVQISLFSERPLLDIDSLLNILKPASIQNHYAEGGDFKSPTLK